MAPELYHRARPSPEPANAPDEYREVPARGALAAYVECFWTRTVPAGASARVLPDGCVDILFFDGVRPRLEAVGTMRAAQVVSSEVPVPIAAARFRPGGAHPFLRVPASELTDASVDLEALWGARAGEATRRIAEAPPEARIAALEEALARRLAALPPIDPYVEAAVELIRRTGGRASAREWCRRTGVSRQYLARKFDAWVGVGPKFLARVVRLQEAVARIRRTPGIAWGELAASADYFDQPHMIADFKALTGLTPEQFLAGR